MPTAVRAQANGQAALYGAYGMPALGMSPQQRSQRSQRRWLRRQVDLAYPLKDTKFLEQYTTNQTQLHEMCLLEKIRFCLVALTDIAFRHHSFSVTLFKAS